MDELERERALTVGRLRALRFRGEGSHASLSRILGAIMGTPYAWTGRACELAVRRLIWLLGGEDE